MALMPGKVRRTIHDRYVSHEGQEWRSLPSFSKIVANKRVNSPTAEFSCSA
jgi:hypothetical protein